jgi:hypothetical protein
MAIAFASVPGMALAQTQGGDQQQRDKALGRTGGGSLGYQHFFGLNTVTIWLMVRTPGAKCAGNMEG